MHECPPPPPPILDFQVNDTGQVLPRINPALRHGLARRGDTTNHSHVKFDTSGLIVINGGVIKAFLKIAFYGLVVTRYKVCCT